MQHGSTHHEVFNGSIACEQESRWLLALCSCMGTEELGVPTNVHYDAVVQVDKQLMTSGYL